MTEDFVAELRKNAKYAHRSAWPSKVDMEIDVEPLLSRAADRIEALDAALGLALERLGAMEPGDSRAVSDEYVAMAAVACDLDDLDSSLAIIRVARSSPETRT